MTDHSPGDILGDRSQPRGHPKRQITSQEDTLGDESQPGGHPRDLLGFSDLTKGVLTLQGRIFAEETSQFGD